MSDPDPLEKRLANLETLVAFQDRSISELDEVLTEFVNRVEELELKAKDLESSAPEVGEQCDPPPHY